MIEEVGGLRGPPVSLLCPYLQGAVQSSLVHPVLVQREDARDGRLLGPSGC